MKPSNFSYRHIITFRALLWLLLLLAAAPALGAPVRLPPVPEAVDLGWVRQPFFESLPAWNIDPFPFPAPSAALPPKPQGPADPTWTLLSQADAQRKTAEGRKVLDSRLHEEAARLYLRAYASDKNGPNGFLALRMAARSFFLGGFYAETAGVATTLVKRSGGGGADLPFYLLKGEALYQKRDLLAARECFRRALTGQFNAATKTRIELRIADASLELGNVAYAEPAYRKALSAPASQRRLPFNAIRYGESLISAGKTSAAAELFRNLDTEADGVPPLARAISLMGAGDVAILSGDLVSAQTAYMKAASIGNFSETRALLKIRMADLAFAGGKRAEALSGYGALVDSPVPAIAREAGYKKGLTLYLQGDFPGVVAMSDGWLARYPGKSGEKEMRKLAAKSGVEMVRAAARANPADRWPALSSLLFAYGRTKELPALYGEIGREWEDALIWGGAADLYSAAGLASRSADMRRIERAEGAYYRGDFPAVLAELGWKDPAREHASGALWLAAKTFFRLGRHAEAEAALRRLGTVQAETAASRDKSPFPPDRELMSFNRAQLGRWAELRDSLKDVPPQPQIPALALIRSMAEPQKPEEGKASAASGGGLYADYIRIRERVRRINSEGEDR